MPEVTQLEKLLKLQQDDAKHVARLEALTRLHNNKDFKELVLQHFLIDDCAANAHNGANIGWPVEKRNDCLVMAAAAGHFKNYMMGVERAGMQAVARAVELAEAIVEAQQGDA